LIRGGLGQTWRALDQQVAIGKQRGQQAINEMRLADDASLQLVAQSRKNLLQASLGLGFGYNHDQFP